MPKHLSICDDASRPQPFCAIASPNAQPRTETPQGGTTLKSRNSDKLRQQRRERLLDAAVRKHGVPGVGALLRALETEHVDLAIDRHLERLVDADPRAIAFLAVGGAR